MSSGSDSFFDWRKIALNLTTACNLRCKMCPVVVRPTESLTRDEAFGVADFAARRGFDQIVVTGGEPTIMPYFWDLMDRLAATPMLVQVLTNAYRLNPDHIARMARMPRLIANVSLDGVGPVHDAIRGEGAFAATDANIRGLIAAGVRVAVNTTVQAGNYRNMLDLYEHLKDYTLEWLGFSFAEYFHGKETIPREQLPECLGILGEIARRNTARKGRASMDQALLKCFKVWLYYPRFMTHPGRDCPVPRRQLAVEANGEVTPCFHYPGWNRKDRNIRTSSLDAIVDSPDFRAEIERAIGPGGCAGCSTLCYFLDEDYRQKTLYPPPVLRARRSVLLAKERIRERCPGLFRIYHRLRGLSA